MLTTLLPLSCDIVRGTEGGRRRKSGLYKHNLSIPSLNPLHSLSFTAPLFLQGGKEREREKEGFLPFPSPFAESTGLLGSISS